ncbi:hypothetical protein [Campylobacter fetus]|nr:hypothetical protein [Campylobacter fetus]
MINEPYKNSKKILELDTKKKFKNFLEFWSRFYSKFTRLKFVKTA